MYKKNLAAQTAAGFKLYGTGHILWLFAAFTLLAIMCAAYKRAPAKCRRGLKRSFAAAGLLMQLARAALLMQRGEYGLSQLPLHLCSISVYLCFVYAFYPKKLSGQFLFAFSLPGWFLALLFPGWRSFGLFDPVCILSFLLHIVPAGFVLMLTFAGEIKPEIRLLPRCAALLAAAALPIYIINIKLDQNFMFLNYPPAGTPLALFAFLGRPGYLLGMLPMAAVIWLGMYGACHRGDGSPRRFAPRNDEKIKRAD